MAAVAFAEALRCRSVAGASGAPPRSARTSRAGPVSKVNDSRWGVGAARSKGGPVTPSAARGLVGKAAAAAKAGRMSQRERLESAKDRLQGLRRIGEVREKGVRSRGGKRGQRSAPRAHGHGARSEREAARDVVSRVAHDDALGAREEKARRGPGTRERHGPQLLATRGVVAPHAEREAVPNARERELQPRAALHVSRQKREDEAGHSLERVEKGEHPRLEDGGPLAQRGLEPVEIERERVRAARGDRLVSHAGRAHEVGHDEGIEAPFEGVALDVPARAVDVLERGCEGRTRGQPGREQRAVDVEQDEALRRGDGARRGAHRAASGGDRRVESVRTNSGNTLLQYGQSCTPASKTTEWGMANASRYRSKKDEISARRYLSSVPQRT